MTYAEASAMKRLLRWLNPNTFGSGLAFGLLFGFFGFQAFLTAVAIQDDFRFKPLRLYIFGSGVYAIPWAIIWGGSGAVCGYVPGHLGTLATVTAFAFGVGYSFWDGPKYLHGWLPITVFVYTVMAMIPCHLIWLTVATLFGRIPDPQE